MRNIWQKIVCLFGVGLIFAKTVPNINEIVKSISDHVGQNSALISLGEHTQIDVNELITKLNGSDINFIGGIFPKVIHGNSILDKGIVINTLKNVESLFLVY